MDDQRTSRGLRTDIQGLRALAVTIVVVYHLFPSSLPGGYVGVDVFFVISGFLITSHLIARVPRSPADFLGFWGRRIRRLLPASLSVIALTLVAVHAIVPSTEWDANAHDARAAALYFVNWELAGRAVSYLTADQNPSAFQHFWSLSVEEQFYLVWPLAIAALALLAALTRIPRRVAWAVGLSVVVGASFVYSVVHTAGDPTSSYFISTTRVWELGVGGLLAVAVSGLPRQRPPLTSAARAVFAWTGLAMIAASTVLYSDQTAFPGSAAALPVVGAAVVIFAGAQVGDGGSPGPLLARRPVQWLGDISYSVYLWHWPLRVLVPFVLGSRLPGMTLTLAQGAVVLATTLVLATLTERCIERPFRSPALASRIRGTLVVAGTAMAVVVAMATAQLVAIGHAEAQDARTSVRPSRPAVPASERRRWTPAARARRPRPRTSCPRPSWPRRTSPRPSSR